MLKKALLISSVSSVLAMFTTNPAFAEKAFENGWYAGAKVGATWAHADWDGVSSITTINEEATPQIISQTWKPHGHHADSAFIGNLTLGYQLVREYLYLAAEIGGNFTSEQASKSHTIKSFNSVIVNQQFRGFNPPFQTEMGTTAIHDKVSLRKNELIIDLKPGVTFKDTFLVYARVGAAFNKLLLKSAGSWTQQGGEIDIPTGAQIQPLSYIASFFQPEEAFGCSKESSHKVGIRVGVGAEYLLTQQLGVSVDYIYTDYGNVSTYSTGEAHAVISPDTPSIFQHVLGIDAPNVGMSTQMVLAGLLYHW